MTISHFNNGSIALAIALAFCSTTHSSVIADEQASIKEKVVNYCKAIEAPLTAEEFPSVNMKAPIFNQEAYDKAVQKYWFRAHQLKLPIFKEMLRESHGHEEIAMSVYINRMMTETSRQATQLLMVSEDVILPLSNFFPYTRTKEGLTAILYDYQVAAAKVQIEMIQNDPDLLANFYRIIAWRGRVLANRTTNSVFLSIGAFSVGTDWHIISQETKEKKYRFYDDRCGYWYTRNFLFLCLATGREDLIDYERLDSWNDMLPVISLWEKWYYLYHHSLVPSKTGCNWRRESTSHGIKEREPFDEVNSGLPRLFNTPETPFANWTGIPPYKPD